MIITTSKLKNTVKNSKLILACLVFALPIFIGFKSIQAQDCVGDYCESGTQSQVSFGQSQSYDVYLRGDKSAIVSANLIIPNNSGTSMPELSFTNVAGNLGEMAAYQKISCGQLDTITVEPNDTKEDILKKIKIPECYRIPTLPISNSSETTSSSTLTSKIYPSYSATYKKITPQVEGNKFEVKLAEAISNGKSTEIMLFYKLNELSRKTLGSYKYTFKTLQSKYKTTSADVSIFADNGLVLSDSAKDKINYKPVTSADELGAKLSSGANSTASSGASNSYYSIGTKGSIYKHSNYIESGETLSVSGKFATSSLLLNLTRILTIVLLCLSIIALLGFWYWHRRKKLNQKAAINPEEQPTVVSKRIIDEDLAGKTNYASTPSNLNMTDNYEDISIDKRAIPFSGVYFRFKRALLERRINSIVFAWLCTLLLVWTGVVLVLIFGVAEYFISNSNYYGSGGFIDILEVVTIIIIAIVVFLAVVSITIGLPYLYAKNIKKTLKIIMHIILSLIVVMIIICIISVIIIAKDKKSSDDHDCYGDYPNCFIM